MNKNIILVAIIVAVCASFVSCINVTPINRENGNLITSEIAVSEFDRINIRNHANVRFHQSEEFRVVVTADRSLYESIEIATSGNTLSIGMRRGSRSNVRLNVGQGNFNVGANRSHFAVDVYAPTLSGVTVSGSGSFENTETLIVPAFAATVAGAGRVTSLIESENFSATVSGSGRIIPVGSSQNAEIRISGSGSFRGSEFVINNATARISGSGSANVHAIENLNANISGSGSIRYQGNPRVESRVSGSGRIRRVD